jgi:prophage regulatory protein
MTTDTLTSTTDRLLRLPEVQARVGLGRSAIYAAMRAGAFPRPVRISSRAVAWAEADIVRWIRDRIAARAAQQAGATIAATDTR